MNLFMTNTFQVEPETLSHLHLLIILGVTGIMDVMMDFRKRIIKAY